MENVARVRYRIQKTSSKIEYHRGRDIDAIKRNLSGDRLRTNLPCPPSSSNETGNGTRVHACRRPDSFRTGRNPVIGIAYNDRLLYERLPPRVYEQFRRKYD